MLSLHYTAPHAPWQGPEDERTSAGLGRGRPGLVEGGSLATYAAMMKKLYDSVGVVLRALASTRSDRETLVILTSDNGGERFSYHWPFSGQKGELREGGIRVPAIVRWPGVTMAGGRSEQVVVTMDWTATILAAAGVSPDGAYPLDGLDLSATLAGARAPYDRTLFWRHGDQDAVRSRQWKYLRNGDTEYLYDLNADVREQAEFQDKHPAILQRLRTEYGVWQAQVLARPAPAG